jgi:uncharacterized protein with von Willebrand factor type A (vWA) domain
MPNNNKLDKAAREEKRAYHKAWRDANPDKVARINANYWRRKAERKLAEQEKGDGSNET